MTNNEIPTLSLSTSSIRVKSFKRSKTAGFRKKQAAPSRWMCIRPDLSIFLSRFVSNPNQNEKPLKLCSPFKSPQLYLHFYSHKQSSFTLSLFLSLCFSVMASIEDSMNPQPTTLLQQQPPQHELQHPHHQQQQQHSSLPQYPEMIMAAIDALNENGGSSKAAISKQMESAYPDLPAAHATLLAHHLGKMKQSGQLAMDKNNYLKPDPNAPPKRGRGRPPKLKAPEPAGVVVSPPRPRGRPPKPRDPFAPPAPSKKKSSGGSGRPRGRPPKKAKTAPPSAASSAPAAATGPPRGRGRPPKVKPAVAPVAG